MQRPLWPLLLMLVLYLHHLMYVKAHEHCLHVVVCNVHETVDDMLTIVHGDVDCGDSVGVSASASRPRCRLDERIAARVSRCNSHSRTERSIISPCSRTVRGNVVTWCNASAKGWKLMVGQERHGRPSLHERCGLVRGEPVECVHGNVSLSFYWYVDRRTL